MKRPADPVFFFALPIELRFLNFFLRRRAERHVRE
jgi:hypothetical protein